MGLPLFVVEVVVPKSKPFFGASDLQETTHTQQAPSKPAKGGALSTAGYYDPARIEVGKTQVFFFLWGKLW